MNVKQGLDPDLRGKGI